MGRGGGWGKGERSEVGVKGEGGAGVSLATLPSHSANGMLRASDIWLFSEDPAAEALALAHTSLRMRSGATCASSAVSDPTLTSSSAVRARPRACCCCNKRVSRIFFSSLRICLAMSSLGPASLMEGGRGAVPVRAERHVHAHVHDMDML